MDSITSLGTINVENHKNSYLLSDGDLLVKVGGSDEWEKLSEVKDPSVSMETQVLYKSRLPSEPAFRAEPASRTVISFSGTLPFPTGTEVEMLTRWTSKKPVTELLFQNQGVEGNGITLRLKEPETEDNLEISKGAEGGFTFVLKFYSCTYTESES